MLTVKDLYDILPVGKSTIYKLLNSGRIEFIRKGNKFLIPKNCLISFLRLDGFDKHCKTYVEPETNENELLDLLNYKYCYTERGV